MLGGYKVKYNVIMNIKNNGLREKENKIKLLRKKKGLTQEQLSNLLQINRHYLSRIETGKSEPTASILKKIGLIFDVDLNVLLDINDKNNNNDKIDYIINNCKCLCDNDLDCVIKLIDYLRENCNDLNAKG